MHHHQPARPQPSPRLCPPASSLQPPASPSGFTLIEMLVSLAITLIMMGAVVTLFGTIADSVSGSRSIIEISERLRATRNRLQADLQGATATMKPPLRPENDEGYFELIEGPALDQNSVSGAGGPLDTARGDVDDVLMFTVRSRGEPFVGKFNGTTVESQVAEVIYFCAPAVNTTGQDVDGTLYVDPGTGLPVRTVTLYRRVLLVDPGLTAMMPAAPLPDYYSTNDVSARYDASGTPKLIANSLGDLTKRENRFAHGAGFPFNVDNTPSGHFTDNAWLTPFIGERLGDDVLLTNVLSFDVQVYDPNAPVLVTGAAALTPSDPGFLSVGTLVAGAYVDLGTDYADGQFNLDSHNTVSTSGVLQPVTPLVPSGQAHTYDTWSLHYENNGVDDDNFAGIDQGTNGLDDNNNGIVDDIGEFETRPPYSAPLRGIRVTIRVYEPSSQQIRQVTIVNDFLPD